MTDWMWRLGVAALIACVALGAPAAAQDEGDDPAEMEAQEELREDLDIDAILADEDAVFAGEDFTYDPAGRRDPFDSLLDARERLPERGSRPEGVPGLLIGEIDLTGIFILSDGPVAQVQATDQDKSYLLRAGDRLFDGSVVSISRDEVVFRQQVDDPAALKPFREVVKKLNP